MRRPDPNFLAAKPDSAVIGNPTVGELNFTDWLNYGIQHNYCGTLVCYNHDGVPMTVEEEQDEEPCVPILRIYDTVEQKTEVENNHSPSIWRQTNLKHTTKHTN